MGLKKELTVQSCTATRLTYFKIRQRVGSCYHRSLWQTAPCVFVRQHRSGPFHLTATLHPASLLYRRGKWTPFYPLWSKVTTQFDIPQKYFKDQRRKCGDLLEKTCSAPPPPQTPSPAPPPRRKSYLWIEVVVGGAMDIKSNGPLQRKCLRNLCSHSRAFPRDKTQIQVTAVWIYATCDFKKIVAIVPIYPLRITDVPIWSSLRSSDYILRGLDTIHKIVREPGLGFSSVEMTGGH